jgi:hypothetical protein
MMEKNFIAQELQEKKHVLEIYKQDTEIWKTKMKTNVLSNALIWGDTYLVMTLGELFILSRKGNQLCFVS